MTIQRKSLSITEMDDSGTGLALIANLAETDHDGDTYEKGAFNWAGPGGQWASMVGSHNWGQRPWGKARVYEEGDSAFAELKLNLDTEEGREWHSTLKFDLATGNPVQEWSFGYDTLEGTKTATGVHLIKLKVIEVSPVLRGAGKGTRTLDVKGLALKDAPYSGLITDLQGMADALSGDPAQLSATGWKQLGDVHVALGAALEAKARGDTPKSDPLSEQAVANHAFNRLKARLGDLGQ